MFIKLKYTFIFIITITLFWSCKNEVVQKMGSKPAAMGRINNVVIVAEQNLTESDLADTISYYFESPYPILTADEPIFDIRYMTPKEVLTQPYAKELRTYVIIADISDTASVAAKMIIEDLGNEKFQRALTDPSFTSSVGQDKWARGQLTIYIFAKGRKNLAQAINKNFPAIAKRINQHDQKNLTATVYGIQGVNVELNRTVLDQFGLNIKIPGLYKKALQDVNLLWVRLDDKEMTQSLVFRKFKYENKNQFKMDNIIKLRNEYGRQYIRTSAKDAYMSTNVIDLPTFEYTYIQNNVYTREVRGIWETDNDFMGGPFVSYMLHNEDKGELVFIDVFVFAPGREKRDLIQQFDCILKTASFPGVAN